MVELLLVMEYLPKLEPTAEYQLVVVQLYQFQNLIVLSKLNLEQLFRHTIYLFSADISC